MTGPHLTPEREAEIRAQADVNGAWLASDGHWSVSVLGWEDVKNLLAALDAEREAHNLTRTALEASTEDLVVALSYLPQYMGDLRDHIDARIMANQKALGLAVAEADKPHHGTER